jgi:hypothetical protein
MEKEENKKPEENLEVPEGTAPEGQIPPEEQTPPEEEGVKEGVPEVGKNRAELNRILGEEIDDYDADADDETRAGLVSQYLTANREGRERMAKALKSDPRFAQALVDVANGKRGAAAALARYFGRDLMGMDEDDPEYEEVIKAEEERRKEQEAVEAGRKEYEENLKASIPVVKDWCNRSNLDMEEFLDNVWTRIVEPIKQGRYNEELLELLNHGFTYDKDIEDAMAAGVVKGKNENIAKLREEKGDGMPKGLKSATVTPKTKKGGSQLLDLATQA